MAIMPELIVNINYVEDIGTTDKILDKINEIEKTWNNVKDCMNIPPFLIKRMQEKFIDLRECIISIKERSPENLENIPVNSVELEGDSSAGGET